MPPKRKGAAKAGKKKEEEVVEEVEAVETKTKTKTAKKTNKTVTPARKPKTKTTKEKKKEQEEAAKSNEEEIQAQQEALEEENNSENEVEDDLLQEEEASINVEESKPIKDYPKYLKKTWLLQIPITHNEELVDDGSYYNVQTGTITQLSDIIKLTKKEEDNLDKITEVKGKDNAVNKSIRKKLDDEGYGIISYARVIGDKDYINELKEAIENKKPIESFEIKPKKTLIVKSKKTNKAITPAKKKKESKKEKQKKEEKEEVEEETEPIALPQEEQELERIDAIYERNVDAVIERLDTATDDNPICVDVINAVEACADTKKSIKKIKLSKKDGPLPNVEFTYPAKTDYKSSDLKELALRYIQEYNSRQEGTKKTNKKSKTKESSKTERTNLTQPRGGPVRTVGDKTVSSVVRPGNITTTGIEAGESKKPVLRTLAAPELLKIVKEMRGKYLGNVNYKPLSKVREEGEEIEVSGEEAEEEVEEVKPRKKEKTTVRVKPLGKKAPAQEEEEEEEIEEVKNSEEGREEENEEEEEEEPEQVELGSDEEVEEDNSQGEVDHEEDEEENSEE